MKRLLVGQAGYTPELRREVAEFELKNRRFVTCKKFNLPPSTVGAWVMKVTI